MSNLSHQILMRYLLAILGFVILCNCSIASENQKPKDLKELNEYVTPLWETLEKEGVRDNSLAMLEPMYKELSDSLEKSGDKSKQTFQQMMLNFLIAYAVTYYPELYAVEKRGLRKEYIAFLKSELYLDYIRKNCPKGYKASIKEINTNRILLMKRFKPKLGLVRRSPEYFEAINIIFGQKIVDIPKEPGSATDSEVYQRFE